MWSWRKGPMSLTAGVPSTPRLLPRPLTMEMPLRSLTSHRFYSLIPWWARMQYLRRSTLVAPVCWCSVSEIFGWLHLNWTVRSFGMKPLFMHGNGSPHGMVDSLRTSTSMLTVRVSSIPEMEHDRQEPPQRWCSPRPLEPGGEDFKHERLKGQPPRLMLKRLHCCKLFFGRTRCWTSFRCWRSLVSTFGETPLVLGTLLRVIGCPKHISRKWMLAGSYFTG